LTPTGLVHSQKRSKRASCGDAMLSARKLLIRWHVLTANIVSVRPSPNTCGFTHETSPVHPVGDRHSPGGAIGRIGLDQNAVDASHLVAPLEYMVSVLRSVHMHDTLTQYIRTDVPSQPQLYIISDISIRKPCAILKEANGSLYVHCSRTLFTEPSWLLEYNACVLRGVQTQVSLTNKIHTDFLTASTIHHIWYFNKKALCYIERSQRNSLCVVFKNTAQRT
jgi:hypothetical protein